MTKIDEIRSARVAAMKARRKGEKRNFIHASGSS